ncbi:hypothetical protein [uncultured Duncaniella sp.]|uniref:hypothetical protein n=1 Tax=uncultured Duncaniella sp. TaxID=2768039 RepID=UPI00272FC0DE|nr:hypothetical protein [uncultured Duncaniella sp.]
MYSKGEMTYAEAYCYLRRRDAKVVTMQVRTQEADLYEEVAMKRPLQVRREGDAVKFGGWFVVRPPSMSYADVKTAVIKLRYSYDDQMAIVLNRENGGEDAGLYERMQAWREFAAEVASGIRSEE